MSQPPPSQCGCPVCFKTGEDCLCGAVEQVGRRTAALTIKELEHINSRSADKAYRVQLKLAAATILACDGHEAARLAARMCPYCFYADSHFAGQAFTEWKCMLCPVTGMHSNTSTPSLCIGCSESFGLCTSCGGDLEMRRRSKFQRKAKKLSRKT